MAKNGVLKPALRGTPHQKSHAISGRLGLAKSKKRVTRKQLLKEPDEFITFTGKMIEFSRKYRTLVLYGATAFCIIILSITGFRYYTNWKEKKAFSSLDQVMSAYKKTLEDKSDLTDVKNDFQAVVDKYSGYAGGKMARVVYANICYRTGDLDTAITLYTEALEDFRDDIPLRYFIQTSLGYAYEAKRDFEKATSYFDEIASAGNAVMNDEVLFNLARLYDEAGNKRKSTETYNRILSDYTDSPYIDMVREKLNG